MTAIHNENNRPQITGFHDPLFGDNVFIFSPEDDPKEVSALLEKIGTKQEAAQFEDRRYAIAFLPGDYDESISVDVGFYTQVMGLGQLPTDTRIDSLKCLARWQGGPDNHAATCNFWRSVENIQINSNTIWAVSQATDMRRVMIDGMLTLHDEYGWCSGGFLSNSKIDSAIDSGTQQQWLSRNNDYKTWFDDNWNIVFMGDSQKQPVTATWPAKSYTTVDSTPVVREKPFLFYDKKNGYQVCVPGFKEDSVGVCWQQENDKIIPIKDFYVAKPAEDNAATINEALASGKHLLLTPGIYELDAPIEITNPDTVVLGLGLATLRSQNGTCLMNTQNVPGIIIAGILFDAGQTESENLLVVGTPDKDVTSSDLLKDNPISLSDVYFRVGGCYTKEPTKSRCCVTVNADYTIGDNLWVWRADHGDQVAWDKNTSANGIIINGNHVKMYALMVEHFQEYQTVWNGEDGTLIMYQSEIPYDVPSQDVWMSRDGKRPGYASIYVADDVDKFSGTAIGIYLFNRDHIIRLESAVEMPKTANTHIHNIITVMLTGNPGMVHIINDDGDSVLTPGATAIIKDY